MSEHDTAPISPEPPIPPASPPRGPRTRLRRFFLRHLPLTTGVAALLFAIAAVGLYFVASSAAFENLVRKRLIAQIETATGGRAEIGSFHWRLLHLEAEADGIVIHGLEDPGDAPYAQIDRLRVQFSVLGFLSPRILLRDLEIAQPRLHLIVYPDGSTNQPHPRRPAKRGKSAIDTLFDLHANRIAVEQGTLDYDNRAAAFDAQNRYLPLDFKANDASLVISSVPASPGAPEFYRIEAGAADLSLARDRPRKKTLPVHGTLQLTLDLERNRLSLRSLRLTAHDPGTKERALEVTGVLEDFNHPRWQAEAAGDLDMRLLDPLTGYPDAPEGIARLDSPPRARRLGFTSVAACMWRGAPTSARALWPRASMLDARVDADPARLLITQIVAHPRQGGQIEGSVDLHPWLPGAPLVPAQITAPVTASGSEASRSARNVLVRAAIIPTLFNGKVTADFKDVALDTVLDMVAAPDYRRLGLDARLNGPAEATWSNGDARTVSVSTALSLSPSGRAPAGEAPTSGEIDATYTQRNGQVDLRNLELHLPGSQLEAHGELGAYPLSSPSALTVDLHSHNLPEFDAALRSLGLERNGKTGTAALPVALAGQADFHGTWTGSLDQAAHRGYAQGDANGRRNADCGWQFRPAAVCPLRFGRCHRQLLASSDRHRTCAVDSRRGQGCAQGSDGRLAWPWVTSDKRSAQPRSFGQ